MRYKSFLRTTAGITLCLLIFSFSYGQQLPEPFLVIPQPREIVLKAGGNFEAGDLRNLVLKGVAQRPVTGSLLSGLILSEKPGKGSVVLTIDQKANLPSPEGYILTIDKKNIEIKATGTAGIFYGCQTLEQLLEDAISHKKTIPSCTITDYPELSYRAVHFDVKHHLDHMNYYYESIDRLARYKINAVVFEFEDKLRYQRQPVVGAPQAISIDEMAALTKYASDRHIEITPLVQGLGHATFILKHEQMAHLRELSWNNWAFCPLHEGTYQVLFDMYRDAIDATPGAKYLHIGGDEIGNIGLCPRCKPMADKEGVLSLSLYWLKRVCEFAGENNRIPVFWDDMPLKYAGVYETTYDDAINEEEAEERWKEGKPMLEKLLEDFPKNCVYMRWNYSMARQPGNIMALDWYRTKGLQTMAATATNTEGGMLFQQEIRNKGNESVGISSIRSFAQLAAEKETRGILCTAWDDKSPHMEYYWRGFIAAAEYSWTPDGRTLEQFDNAWLWREFGLSVPDYQVFHDKLREGTEFWFKALYKNGGVLNEDNVLMSLPRLEHWLPALAGQEKVLFDYSSKLIGLPDKNTPGSWTEQYKERLEKAEQLLIDYPEISKRLHELYKASKRNRYYWELFDALLEFQMTTPILMIALKESDVPNANYTEVKKAMTNFYEKWENLNRVYSKTRFISYPPNFLPDRYFHLASQREDLSWMIQAQELLFKKIADE